MTLQKTVLAIGIAIIFALLIGYTVHAIYERPHNPNWTYEQSEQVSDEYNFNLFIIFIIIGSIAIVIGLFIPSLESIGSGILGGGILVTIYGILRGWGVLNKYLKIAILFVVLILLIYLGYKKLEKRFRYS